MVVGSIWNRMFEVAPYSLRFLIRNALNGADIAAAVRFVSDFDVRMSTPSRLRFLSDIYRISYRVDCAHTQSEILECASLLLRLPAATPGVFVEAGCYKGGSTCKFSLAARIVNRKLVAFDSFEGLPDNDERHGKTILGESPNFAAGRYRGALDEVRENVNRHGAVDVCEFVKGWFDQTMPGFNEPIAVAYLDVDLVSSTRTCLSHLYPLLSTGGAIFSQDGHLPLVVELLRDEGFWRDEVGCPMPPMSGLGTRKLVGIFKPKE